MTYSLWLIPIYIFHICSKEIWVNTHSRIMDKNLLSLFTFPSYVRAWYCLSCEKPLKLVTIHPDPTWCRYMYVFVCINIGGKNTHRPCPNPSPATSEPPFQSSFHLMTMTWGPLNMFIWNYGVVSTWSSQKYRFPHQILYLIFFSSSMWGTQYMPYFFPFSSHYMYTHYLPCRIVLCVTDF